MTRPEITPNQKYLRAVFHSMHGADEMQTGTDAECLDKCLRKGDEAANEGFLDANESVGTIPGRNPVSESCSHETWT